jgi:hypothetical protein
MLLPSQKCWGWLNGMPSASTRSGIQTCPDQCWTSAGGALAFGSDKRCVTGRRPLVVSTRFYEALVLAAAGVGWPASSLVHKSCQVLSPRG